MDISVIQRLTQLLGPDNRMFIEHLYKQSPNCILHDPIMILTWDYLLEEQGFVESKVSHNLIHIPNVLPGVNGYLPRYLLKRSRNNEYWTIHPHHFKKWLKTPKKFKIYKMTSDNNPSQLPRLIDISIVEKLRGYQIEQVYSFLINKKMIHMIHGICKDFTGMNLREARLMNEMYIVTVDNETNYVGQYYFNHMVQYYTEQQQKNIIAQEPPQKKRRVGKKSKEFAEVVFNK